MPNRILREGINDSKAVNSLSDSGEIFYRRLISVVDDFGRFDADPEIIRGEMFKRKLDQWSLERIAAALEECSRTQTQDGLPLLLVYEIGQKKFLEVQNFGQRVRSTKSKYPAPMARHVVTAIRGQVQQSAAECGGVQQSADNRGQVRTSADNCRPHTETYSETYSESETQTETAAPPVLREMPRREDSQSPPSMEFSSWWMMWANTRGTNHRPQAESAYYRLVTVANEAACMACTASYLTSLENPSRGYNPENFLEQQVRDQFRATWPARASPAAKLSVTQQAIQQVRERMARGEDVDAR